MLAFPLIVVNVQGESEFLDGTLFSLPAELCDSYRIQQYLKINKLGWTKSEFGYMTLVKADGLGNTYIVPGLFLVGCDRPTKQIYGYKAQFTKVQVEQYLDYHFERLVNVRDASEGELTALVHDLRHLSSSIYHSALEVDTAIKESVKDARAAVKAKSMNSTRDMIKNINQAKDMVKTIIASQTMLKVRIDYLDYSNAVDRFDDIEKIPVYSRVDKVIRCFRTDAKHKRINISLNGNSYRLAEGPNILDIVPYTLIENAIKYAPEQTDITVSVTDTDHTTKVSVTSLGPVFDTTENKRIFEKGFRGKNAVLVRTNGTGLGLTVALSVIEKFKGSISAEQSSLTELIGIVPYAETKFCFSLPTSGEDNNRRRKAEKYKKRTFKGDGLRLRPNLSTS